MVYHHPAGGLSHPDRHHSAAIVFRARQAATPTATVAQAQALVLRIPNGVCTFSAWYAAEPVYAVFLQKLVAIRLRCVHGDPGVVADRQRIETSETTWPVVQICAVQPVPAVVLRQHRAGIRGFHRAVGLSAVHADGVPADRGHQQTHPYSRTGTPEAIPPTNSRAFRAGTVPVPVAVSAQADSAGSAVHSIHRRLSQC